MEILFKSVGIKMGDFWFHAEGDKIQLGDNSSGLLEFKEKIIDADFKTKKKLMENKIFAYFMKKTKTNIFSKKQIRALKLENIS